MWWSLGEYEPIIEFWYDTRDDFPEWYSYIVLPQPR
jgi:hypothetical protein